MVICVEGAIEIDSEVADLDDEIEADIGAVFFFYVE